jgi:hypothetical protein
MEEHPGIEIESSKVIGKGQTTMKLDDIMKLMRS